MHRVSTRVPDASIKMLFYVGYIMGNIMDQVRIRRAVRIMRSKGFLRCAGIAVLFSSSGCALTNPEGFEFGAKLGMYATHEHSESTKTVASPCRGLKSWVVGCGTQSTGEGHGS